MGYEGVYIAWTCYPDVNQMRDGQETHGMDKLSVQMHNKWTGHNSVR